MSEVTSTQPGNSESQFDQKQLMPYFVKKLRKIGVIESTCKPSSIDFRMKDVYSRRLETVDRPLS
jgi:hypothetical protein